MIPLYCSSLLSGIFMLKLLENGAPKRVSWPLGPFLLSEPAVAEKLVELPGEYDGTLDAGMQGVLVVVGKPGP